MPSITHALRSLGNGGAVANVRTVLDRRQGEDWLIAGLALRLEQREQTLVSMRTTDRAAGVA